MLDLSPQNHAVVQAIVDSHLPGAAIKAFGSRVTGRARQFSDLDLAVLTDEAFTERAFSDARQALEDSDLPIRVDLVRWSQLPTSIRDTIALTGVDFGADSGLSFSREQSPSLG